MNPNNNLYSAALLIAMEGHKGQLRKDGRAYITHPIAVAGNIIKLFPKYAAGWPRETLIIQAVALVHDLEEDTHIDNKEFIRRLLSSGIELSDKEQINIMEALNVLNKNNHSSYLKYILACRENEIARMVKLADLMHNLSDLEKGSLKDKYQLAYHILDNRYT